MNTRRGGTHPRPRKRRAGSRTKPAAKKSRKWSHQVTTVSTFPPEGLYTQDAKTIARVMASKRVSPKGIGSAIRMVQFYINRAGKNLSPERLQELEQAKQLLQKRLHGRRSK